MFGWNEKNRRDIEKEAQAELEQVQSEVERQMGEAREDASAG